MHLILSLRGGYAPPNAAIGIAAGGYICQTIVADTHIPNIWQPDCSTIFNVQIVNSEHFRNITGQLPPSTPITAEAYAAHGYPYYKIFNEKPSSVQGAFKGIKSVNEKDVEGKPSVEKAKAVAEVIKDTNNGVVLLNEKGQRVGFRAVFDLDKCVSASAG